MADVTNPFLPFPKFDETFPGLGRTPIRKGQIYIYVLVGTDGCVRYVGMTTSPKQRERKHREAKTDRALDRWKRSDPGFKFTVVDAGPVSQWDYLERGWISYYRGLGRLYNVADGGTSERAEYEAALRRAQQRKQRNVGRLKATRREVAAKKARDCPLSNWGRKPAI